MPQGRKGFIMNVQQLERMHTGKGFIAALDQSGGSTPKALRLYGIGDNEYSSETEMFDLIHEMRTRIVTNPAFTSEHILGAILFEQTMDREIGGKLTADYLWDDKGIVPFLKVDKGLADENDGVQLLKPMPNLDDTLRKANERHIFGTKMRSVIKAANEKGIKKIVDQQFEIGERIFAAGLVPIIEPEVDINIPDKKEAEDILFAELKAHLEALPDDTRVIFKLTLPTVADLYAPLLTDKHVVRVVALSGGYSRAEANELLEKNHGVVASFSRALTEGLSVKQTDEEFTQSLRDSIVSIYNASLS